MSQETVPHPTESMMPRKIPIVQPQQSSLGIIT